MLDHFTHAVGLDRLGRESFQTLHLDSSYEFERNMAVVVAGDIPDPRDRESYLTALERVLVDAHLAMGGSVLTLFTNRRDMEDLYARVEPKMARAGLELNCQQRNSSPRRLRDRFINEPTSSLFALKAFWEGFDASGETLRCVIIPKLPFSSPTDPLSCERNLREDRAWARYSLPEAVLGGCTVMMFGNIILSGFQMIAEAGFTQRNITIAALSLTIGIGFTQVSDIFAQFPALFRQIFASNCIAVAFVVAVILNAVLPGEERFLSAPAKNED